ncbi:hypothetical protein OIU76_018967 [Salix suchowensis]|nr:hypothetical protein OIU76_018967 [Salix suchowensis]
MSLAILLSGFKNVIRLKNIKLIVAVVQSSANDEISEDRMTLMRKRAEIDTKYLVVFNASDDLQLKQSLDRLGSTFAELANVYYKEEGLKVKTRVEKKSFNSHVAVASKLLYMQSSGETGLKL